MAVTTPQLKRSTITKRTLAAAALLAGATLLASCGPTSSQPTQAQATTGASAPSEAHGSLASCSPEEGFEKGEECFTQAFANLTASDPVDLSKTALGLEGMAPAMCLHPALKFTRDAVDGDSAAAVNYVKNVDTTACEGGFLYGALAGAIDAGRDTLKDVSEACSVMQDEPQYRCAHGVGLTLWTNSEDVSSSAEVCAQLWSDQARAQCGVGVLMGYYEWGDAQGQRPDMFEAWRQLPEYCTRWPLPDVPGMLQGCANGVAYIVSRPIAALADEVPSMDGGLDKEAAELLRDRSDQAVAACLELGEAWQDSCMDTVAAYTARRPPTSELATEIMNVVCDAYPKGAYSRCKEQLSRVRS